MSRYTQQSYGHRCQKGSMAAGYWLISWYVDYYYSGSRLRYPRRFTRVTDAQGASRFRKKWKLEDK